MIPRLAPTPWKAARRSMAARGPIVVILAALISLASLAGLSASSPSEVLAQGPLPTCRYVDILTAPRTYADWSTTLVDTILAVPASYVPPDLTPVSAAGITGTGKVRAIVIDDLRAMTEAAAAAGNPIGVQSAYRSYAQQITTFAYWVNLDGYAKALLYSARPGHSEHQLGVAIDFRSATGGPPWSGSDWGLSPAGSWMKQHAWEFGFIQSYPKGKKSITCYDYESWHYRYVGRAEAASIHASGLTTRQYLWAHYTTTIVPAAGSGAPSPTPARPSGRPSRSPATSAAASGQPSQKPGASSSATAGGPAGSSAATPAGAVRSLPPLEPPAAPAATILGLDPATAGIGALLVVLLVALGASVAMGRRRHGASGPPGMGL